MFGHSHPAGRPAEGWSYRTVDLKVRALKVERSTCSSRSARVNDLARRWRQEHAGPVITAQSESKAGCLICAEHAGTVDVPGGLLDDGSVVTFHVPQLDEDSVYAGHLLVTSKRHVADFAGLDPQESGAVGMAIGKYSRALKSLGAARVYVATIGHRVEHLHVHLLPRWPETPADLPWHRVDEWDGARRLASSEVERMMAELRSKSH